MTNMTDTGDDLRVLNVLIHALGFDRRRYEVDGLPAEPYRNHFVAGPGHHSMPALEAAVERGLMVRGAATLCGEGSEVFCATPAGVAHARAAAMARRPRLTRSQRRYRRWLCADSDRTFGEWLKDGGR